MPGSRPIKLALQGGGSHGAFTWGVLDALLEDGRLHIRAISGTSAGAMNAVVLAHGLLNGGHEGARAALAQFWARICEDSGFAHSGGETSGSIPDGWMPGRGLRPAALQHWFACVTRHSSPYQFNPLNINPLRAELEAVVDFERLRATDGPDLHIAATNVRTGKLAVFERPVLTADHVLASACIPTIFQAVEIDGDPHWDGGYLGNPVLYPLYGTRDDVRDIVIVQINPVQSSGAPRTLTGIQDRVNEIAFNSALLSELNSIETSARLAADGGAGEAGDKYPLLHRIGGDDELAAFAGSSRLDTRWRFLASLRDAGRDAARAWLERHYGAIGVHSTMTVNRD
ncbi:MAG: patatin-like phospholipase family protein [Beijerinckiaceae bacterium]